MIKKSRLLLFALIFIVVAQIEAQQKKSIATKRPKVGLVLSGGGTKGFAYIGLLKVLEEVNLHVDYIAGTSIGAIIGGLYAVGYAPDTIKQIIRSQNWDNLLNDVINRKYTNFEDKVYGEKYIIDFPLEKKSIALRSSLHEGQQINLLLTGLFSSTYKITDFSKLPTPFLCVGTNLLTGETVELTNGDLAMALRSSMSIPGFFSPTYYQGKYLVDGGVVDNFPVINVKKKGIPFIIGGNVQQGLTHNPEKLNSITKVLDQIISFNREAANKAAYANTNLLINYNINYNIMDFNNYDSVMAEGDRTARVHYGELKALADSLNAIEMIPVVKHNAKPLDSLYVNEIVLEGLHKLHTKYVEHFFKDLIHKKISLKDLEERIQMAYGTNYFDHLFYQLKPSNNQGITLILKIKEKSLGTLRAGVHYDNDYLGSLMIGATFRNLLPATKLYADVVLGPSPRFRSLFLIDNGKLLGFGAKLNFYAFNFNLYENETKINQLIFSNYSASVFANKTVKNFYNFRTGFQFEHFKFRNEYYTHKIPSKFFYFHSYGNFFLSFRSDTYDNPLFPKTGFQSALVIKYVFPFENSYLADFFSKNLIAYLQYNQAVVISPKFTLKPGLFVGGIIKGTENPPYQYLFALGGQNPSNYIENFQPFTGLHFIQVTGNYVAVGRLKLQYQLAHNHYVTLKTDFGSISDKFNTIADPAQFILGYGLTYSYNSFVGPIELTMMSSSKSKELQLFINIGFWF